jgi:hypothetical protein
VIRTRNLKAEAHQPAFIIAWTVNRSEKSFPNKPSSPPKAEAMISLLKVTS